MSARPPGYNDKYRLTIITGLTDGTKADWGPIGDVLSIGRPADWRRLTLTGQTITPIEVYYENTAISQLRNA